MKLIPTSERRPRNGRFVLFCVLTNYSYIGEIFEWSPYYTYYLGWRNSPKRIPGPDTLWFAEGVGLLFNDNRVTHWAPLPRKPQIRTRESIGE